MLSLSQEITVAAAAVLSGCLSICGSLIVLRLTRRKIRLVQGHTTAAAVRISEQDVSPVYQSIMMALSISDIIFSLTVVFQIFFGPQDVGYQIAVGNTASCTLIGLLMVVFNMT